MEIMSPLSQHLGWAFGCELSWLSERDLDNNKEVWPNSPGPGRRPGNSADRSQEYSRINSTISKTEETKVPPLPGHLYCCLLADSKMLIT
jgi:hypothetical protein